VFSGAIAHAERGRRSAASLPGSAIGTKKMPDGDAVPIRHLSMFAAKQTNKQTNV
jgi:hypothetical protein